MCVNIPNIWYSVYIDNIYILFNIYCWCKAEPKHQPSNGQQYVSLTYHAAGLSVFTNDSSSEYPNLVKGLFPTDC